MEESSRYRRLSIAQVWLVDPACGTSDSAEARALTAFGRWPLGALLVTCHDMSYMSLITSTSLNRSKNESLLNAVFEWTCFASNPFGQSSSQPRFSGAFDIHCFASAKKLTKWAAAFDRGRAHVVMQCDSVQSLQRILGTIRTSEPKSLLG